MKKTIISLIACLGLFYCSTAFAYEQEALNYNNQGISCTKKGDYIKAIDYFKKAINADSSLTNAYYNLGSVYKYTGKPNEALNAFKLLMRNNPSDDEAAYLIAELYFEQSDYDKSLLYINSINKESAYYQKSLELFKKINNKINESVVKDASKKETSSLAPVSSIPKYTFEGFKGPAGITEDSKGFLYAVDFPSDSIQVFYPDGKLKTTIKNDLIKGPLGIAVDSKDNIYVANYNSNNIAKIYPNQTVEVFLKDIQKPYFLYFDKAGVLFVSEQTNNTVIRLGIPK